MSAEVTKHSSLPDKVLILNCFCYILISFQITFPRADHYIFPRIIMLSAKHTNAEPLLYFVIQMI